MNCCKSYKNAFFFYRLNTTRPFLLLSKWKFVSFSGIISKHPQEIVIFAKSKMILLPATWHWRFPNFHDGWQNSPVPFRRGLQDSPKSRNVGHFNQTKNHQRSNYQENGIRGRFRQQFLDLQFRFEMQAGHKYDFSVQHETERYEDRRRW